MSKMAGTKRHAEGVGVKSSKKAKVDYADSKKAGKPGGSKTRFVENENGEEGDDFIGFADGEADGQGEFEQFESNKVSPAVKDSRSGGGTVLNGSTSREAHAKQKVLRDERKSAKANADDVHRSKKLWERLRRKSHVPKDEREKLVKELFEIITGRVREFVFKHDAVRIIQCALKYATPAQKKSIAQELAGHYRELAESKYAKFLVAKLVVIDNEIRDLVVPEFYGHVKRLMRHPEASWIVDDIYRGLASSEQKAVLLREWYGPEFVVFRNDKEKLDGKQLTADLATILAENPEKRGPIMQHLKEMTNQLVQKKTTGFTMLHDALLQYFLNCRPGSPEATEVLELLRDDEQGDCCKNLAFTKSGSRLLCLALAYGGSKDRRTLLKFFKTHIKLLAADPNGHHVLLTAYEVIDDTVMSAKAIFPELLSKDLGQEEREQELLGQVLHLIARIPLLYLFTRQAPKWLVTEEETKIVDEVREHRSLTSKKDPETRRIELVKAISQPLLDLIASQANTLTETSFGCQFISQVLLGGIGDKGPALEAVVNLADFGNEFLETPHVGRMLKTLVQGGWFDKDSNALVSVDPPLGFHNLLYRRIVTGGKENIAKWASGPNSFVIVAMLEAEDFGYQDELKKSLLSAKLESDHPGTKILKQKLGIEKMDKSLGKMHEEKEKNKRPKKNKS